MNPHMIVETGLSKHNITLTKYQRNGVRWMEKKERGIDGVRGGLLADEMGLGKTLQMIALILCGLVRNVHQRTLIIVPPVLLSQWEKEFKRACGSSVCVVYHGKNKCIYSKRDLCASRIVISSYRSLLGSELVSIPWDRVVFDEGHCLRNPKGKTHICALRLKTSITWIMTGTPIQNGKKDIFALMNLIIKGADVSIQDVRSMMLRRTKVGLGLDMPLCNITEVTVGWGNTGLLQLAKDVHGGCGKMFCKKIGDTTGDGDEEPLNSVSPRKLVYFTKNQFIFAAMMYARYSCLIPTQIQKSVQDVVGHDEAGLYMDADLPDAFLHNAKLQKVIMDILERRNNGKGKIVFCHFRSEIDILNHILRTQGLTTRVYDGRTEPKCRAKVAEVVDVLILQIKSGSEGLNLQDNFSEIYFTQPHWNPSVEDQAVARCHRMGQKKDVDVYKYNMTSIHPRMQSIDGYITGRQNMKRDEIVQFFDPDVSNM
jgi:SNF2 family DNA or RNA helicase